MTNVQINDIYFHIQVPSMIILNNFNKSFLFSPISRIQAFSISFRMLAYLLIINNIQKRMLDEDDYKRTIYVGNLPETVTEQMLQAFFSPFGHIKDVKIPIDHVSEKMRGYAFVEFDQREDAMAAIDNYDQTEFLERTIRVRKSKPVDMKPNYQDAVWRNDDWLQNIEKTKLENEKYTMEEQAKARALGLPIFKNMQKKEEKPLAFVEEDD